MPEYLTADIVNVVNIVNVQTYFIYVCYDAIFFIGWSVERRTVWLWWQVMGHSQKLCYSVTPLLTPVASMLKIIHCDITHCRLSKLGGVDLRFLVISSVVHWSHLLHCGICGRLSSGRRAMFTRNCSCKYNITYLCLYSCLCLAHKYLHSSEIMASTVSLALSGSLVHFQLVFGFGFSRAAWFPSCLFNNDRMIRIKGMKYLHLC